MKDGGKNAEQEIEHDSHPSEVLSEIPSWRSDAGSDRRRDVIELAGGELAQLIDKAGFRERLDLKGVRAGILDEPVVRPCRQTNEPGEIRER